MSTLALVLLVVAVAIAALLAYAATRPDTFRVERTARIGAPPERVFPLLADFHRWGAWSPWENLDPAMTRTHSGAAAGVGSVYEWSGNSKAGAGRMEIVEATPPSHLTVRLDFTRPFESSNTTEFALAPEGDGTRVTWSMHGPMLFMTKVMCVFVPMDRLVGKDFEAGLANLKAAAEQPQPVA